MPKREFSLRSFIAGIITRMSREDVPDQALVDHSLNVEPNLMGNLRTMRGMQLVNMTALVGEVKWMDRFNLGTDLIMYYLDGTSAGFYHIPDKLPSNDVTTPTLVTGSDTVGVTVDKISAVQKNQAVHIGVGPAENRPPQWIGKVQHTQFGVAPTGNVEMYAGEVTRPDIDQAQFPDLYKVVKTGAYHVGIRYGGVRLYMFTADAYEKSSTLGLFDAATALCADSEAGYVWIYDSGDDLLKRYDIAGDVMTNAIQPIGLEIPDDEQVTDIMLHDGRIYVAITNLSTYKESKKWTRNSFIYSLERSTTNVSSEALNHSFRLQQPTVQPYIDNLYSGTVYQLEVIGGWNVIIPPICLVPGGSRVGLLCTPSFSGSLLYYTVDGDKTSRVLVELTDRQLYKVGANVGRVIICWINTSQLALYSPGVHELSGIINGAALGGLAPDTIGQPERPITGLVVETVSAIDYIFICFMGATQASVVRLVHTPYNALATAIHMQAYDNTYGFSLLDTDVILAPMLIDKDPQKMYFWSGHPHWNGRYMKTALDGTLPERLNYSLSTISLAAEQTGWTDSNSEGNYFYRISYLFDGFQESPLSDPENLRIFEPNRAITVEIRLVEANVPRRATHLLLYRAEAIDGDAPDTFYRLVEQIELSPAYPLLEDSFGAITYTYRNIEYVDRTSPARLGPTYEANAGVPENLDRTMVHYGISAAVNDRLFVADCWHPNYEDSSFFLFRSRLYQFDVFNWAEDVIRLPIKPIGMAESYGRLIIFDQTDAYVIDPENMYVEKKLEGMGIRNRYAYFQSHAGVYSGSISDIFHIQGLDSRRIGQEVNGERALVPYKDTIAENPSYPTMLGFSDPEQRLVVFGTYDTGLDYNQYLYNHQVEEGWWSIQQIGGYHYTRICQSMAGNILAFNLNAGKFGWLFHGDYEATGTAYLKTMDFGDANIDKWLYKVKIDYEGTAPTLNISLNDTAFANVVGTDEVAGAVRVYDLNKAIAKKLQLRLGLSATTLIRSVSVIFREKVVKGGT